MSGFQYRGWPWRGLAFPYAVGRMRRRNIKSKHWRSSTHHLSRYHHSWSSIRHLGSRQPRLFRTGRRCISVFQGEKKRVGACVVFGRRENIQTSPMSCSGFIPARPVGMGAAGLVRQCLRIQVLSREAALVLEWGVGLILKRDVEGRFDINTRH